MTTRGALKSWLANGGLFIASLALALVGAEIVLRYLGHQPFEDQPETALESSWAQPDPLLGWTYRPNSTIDSGGGLQTVWPDATRRTRPTEYSSAPRHALLIGCSYSQSYGLRDEKSLGWLLQEKFPSLDVRNRATGGYGSYQSLLALRRHLAAAKKPTTLVIYGLGTFHGVRDLAHSSWMSGLKPFGNMLALLPPHVRLGMGDELIERPGQYVFAWPIARWSAIANLVQHAATRWLIFSNNAAVGDDIRAILLVVRRMDALSRQHGARFVAAIIHAHSEQKPDLFAQLDRLGVAYIDCSPPEMPFRHPDEYWTARYAACVAAGIS